MADTERPTPAEDPSFETDTVAANRAIENGQGLGAREIAAQRDPGGERTADEVVDEVERAETPSETAP